jgi:hypothetical protein
LGKLGLQSHQLPLALRAVMQVSLHLLNPVPIQQSELQAYKVFLG